MQNLNWKLFLEKGFIDIVFLLLYKCENRVNNFELIVLKMVYIFLKNSMIVNQLLISLNFYDLKEEKKLKMCFSMESGT